MNSVKNQGRLNGKIALVTGAGKGIGRAISITLGQEGATVILTSRTRTDLESVGKVISQSPGQSHIITADLAQEDQIKSLVEEMGRRFQRLDILVNNAGMTHSSSLEQTDTQAWDRCMALNARGPFILCREALRLLRAGAPSHIVNISSVVGVKGYPLQTAYTASKHALRGMSMAMAEELKSDKISVHVICPGGVATDMAEQVRPDIPNTELILPDEIAELVLLMVCRHGRGVIDEIHIRRKTSSPWF